MTDDTVAEDGYEHPFEVVPAAPDPSEMDDLVGTSPPEPSTTTDETDADEES